MMKLSAIHNIITESCYRIIIEKNNIFEYINIDYLNKNIDDFSEDLSRLKKHGNAKVISIDINRANGKLQVLCKE